MEKYDVITFGSASEDIFVFAKNFFKKNFCFPANEKIEMNNIFIKTGGGGTNTAATFGLQGLKTAYCGSIGSDWAGEQIKRDLKKFNVSDALLYEWPNKKTNCSVILSKKQKGRVLLIYREASNFIPKNFDYKKLKTKWFYIAPLAGEMADEINKILDFAQKEKIKVALNPSKEQIRWLKKNYKKILPKIDVLTMNSIEAKMFLENYNNLEKAFNKIKPYFKGIFTTGSKKEIIVFQNSYIYRTKLMGKKIADITGGGDAFGSGLVAQIIKQKDINQAIQFACANVCSCIQKWGAKEGLLKKNEKYLKVKVQCKKIN